MNTALLNAQLPLPGVFLVTSLSTLAGRPGSRHALLDFGVPVSVPLKILLPLAEIAVAATLILSGRSATVPA
jgi:hypothetical protein